MMISAPLTGIGESCHEGKWLCRVHNLLPKPKTHDLVAKTKNP